MLILQNDSLFISDQSAKVVEYTDCISVGE